MNNLTDSINSFSENNMDKLINQETKNVRKFLLEDLSLSEIQLSKMNLSSDDNNVPSDKVKKEVENIKERKNQGCKTSNVNTNNSQHFNNNITYNNFVKSPSYNLSTIQNRNYYPSHFYYPSPYNININYNFMPMQNSYICNYNSLYPSNLNDFMNNNYFNSIEYITTVEGSSLLINLLLLNKNSEIAQFEKLITLISNNFSLFFTNKNTRNVFKTLIDYTSSHQRVRLWSSIQYSLIDILKLNNSQN